MISGLSRLKWAKYDYHYTTVFRVRYKFVLYRTPFQIPIYNSGKSGGVKYVRLFSFSSYLKLPTVQQCNRVNTLKQIIQLTHCSPARIEKRIKFLSRFICAFIKRQTIFAQVGFYFRYSSLRVYQVFDRASLRKTSGSHGAYVFYLCYNILSTMTLPKFTQHFTTLHYSTVTFRRRFSRVPNPKRIF